jgi:hypothetical protein
MRRKFSEEKLSLGMLLAVVDEDPLEDGQGNSVLLEDL